MKNFLIDKFAAKWVDINIQAIISKYDIFSLCISMIISFIICNKLKIEYDSFITLPIYFICNYSISILNKKAQKYAEEKKQEENKSKPEWHLDLFSTILSRKHSYHKRCGKKLYIKTKKR